MLSVFPLSAEEMRAPVGYSEPALVVHQGGTDVAWDNGRLVDFPNGAWGLEVILPGVDGMIQSLDATDAEITTRWIDLASMSEAQAEAYRSYYLGHEQYRYEDAQVAADLWALAGSLSADGDDMEMSVHARYLQAIALTRLGKHTSAIDHLEALARTAEVPEYFLPQVLYAAGTAQYRLGRDLTRAATTLERAAAMADARGNEYVWVVASRNLCYATQKIDVGASIQCYRQLLQDPRTQKYRSTALRLKNGLALALGEIGQIDEARESFRQLIIDREEIEDFRGVAITQHNLASLERSQGRLGTALGLLLKAYNGLTRENVETFRLQTMNELGDLYRELGDPKTASTWYRRAAEADTDLVNYVSLSLIGLAKIELAMGNVSEANAYLNRVRVDPDNAPNVALEAGLQALELAQGNDQGLNESLIQQLRNIADRLRDQSFIARVAYWEAVAAANRGEWTSVEQLLSPATLPDSPLKTRLLAIVLDARRMSMQGEIGDARQRMLDAIELEADLLSSTPEWYVMNRIDAELWAQVLQYTWIDPALSSQQRNQELWRLDLRRRSFARFTGGNLSLTGRDAQAMSILDAASKKALAEESVSVEDLALLARLDLMNEPTPAEPVAATSQPVVPTISYWMTERLSIALAHDGERISIVELADQARSYSMRLARAGSEVGYHADLALASAALLAPVLPALPDQGPLNIAVDSHLAAVPFESLVIGNQLMLERYEIAYVHHPLAAEPAPIRLQKAAVLANPNYAGVLPQLGHSLGEAELVATLFADVSVATGTDADRSALQQAASQNLDVLHLAAHGRASLEWATWTGLWLSGNEFVSAREIAASQLMLDLVVLSACSTSVGDLEQSGTAQTLALAWLMAGADSVISTLWDVYDTSALTFSEYLYEGLKTKPLRQAVADAKREMLYSGVWSAAEFWAPFQLWIGDQGPAAQADTEEASVARAPSADAGDSVH